MTTGYRIVYQRFDQNKPNEILSEDVLLEDEITIPTNIFDITMGHKNQIRLVKMAQDSVVNAKAALLHQDMTDCPECKNKLVKFGKQYSTLHDVFTDHTVKIQRLKCKKCGYETPSTIRKLLGTIQTGELKEIQSTLGAHFTYRESEQILALFSTSDRRINNHDRVKQVTENIGTLLSDMLETEKEIITVEAAKELVVNIDGGHINTVEDKRSMEALTSVVYRPGSLKSNKKGTRHDLESKHCAASVRDDNQSEIISGTIVAALKQGLNETTKITALCDGAVNCWRVVDALKPLCAEVTSILDWFHLGMKIDNISLPKTLKIKLLRIKWHLWRGHVDRALVRLQELIKAASNEKDAERVKKLLTYITNNKDRIVNYRERKKQGLVFTSNLAESTVESFINRRCKGQQHMRWSREGLNPLLQLRAAINSQDDWGKKWRTAVRNAA